METDTKVFTLSQRIKMNWFEYTKLMASVFLSIIFIGILMKVLVICFGETWGAVTFLAIGAAQIIIESK